MRLNLPVTDREFIFPSHQTLVSMTDLKGRIVYCNPAFVEVSGYALDELMGQPHNLIRHPDMPACAFEDMWATIAGGNPWSAAVKNRRKDGSHYWVMANVTPVLESGAPVGYMSVRTHATRDTVAAAKAMYERLDAQAKLGGSMRLVRGRLLHAGWRGMVGRVVHPGLGSRLTLVAAALACASFAAGVWAAGDAAAGWRVWPAVTVVAAAVSAATWTLRGLALTPLRSVLRFCNRMAAGDLSQRLPTQHAGLMSEVAGSLNQLNVNLLSVVGDARGEAEQLSAATAEIVDGNVDLSARTESQAANLEQTAASMEQIAGAVRQSSQTAAEAARLSGQADRVTRSSREAVDTLCDSINAIDAG